MPLHRSTMLLMMLAGLAAAAPAGCANGPAAAPADPDEQPITVAGRSGVEVRAWVVDDSDGRLDEMLSELKPPVEAINQTMLESWSRAGFTIRAMPVVRVADLQERTKPSADVLRTADMRAWRTIGLTPAATHSQWLDLGPAWTSAIRGPARAATVVALHDGRTLLPAGALRLLGRCWVVPAPDGESSVRPALRLQLVPQVEQPDTRERDPLQAPHSREIVDQGLVLKRLLLNATLQPGEALVIIPEGTPMPAGPALDAEPAKPAEPVPPKPDSLAKPTGGPGVVKPDAAATSPAADAPPAAQPASADQPENSQAPTRPLVTSPATAGKGRIGPDSGPAMSLGQHMLSAAGGTGAARVIVVIIPSLPAKAADGR